MPKVIDSSIKANEQMDTAIYSYLYTAPEVKGVRNADGLLVLPKEEDDDWEL